MYAIIKSNAESIICLPSHVSATTFTLAAFDNFNHLVRNSLSGGPGAHDTSITLFQEHNDTAEVKPLSSIKNLMRLPCQKHSKLQIR